MAGHDRCTQDRIGALFRMYLGETLRLAIQDRPIDLCQRERKRLEEDALGGRLLFSDPYMGNLRVGVGTPGDGEGRGFLTSHKERVGQDGPRQKVSGVGELMAGADITGGKDTGIGGS